MSSPSDNSNSTDNTSKQVHDPFIEEGLYDRAHMLVEFFPDNMGDKLGMVFTHFAKDLVIAEMPVDHRTIQPFGLLHGGASVALAESVASVGAWLNVPDESYRAVGIEINANHLRPAKIGERVEGRATPIHMGRQTHVWDVEIRTLGREKLVCKSRCTLAIIKAG